MFYSILTPRLLVPAMIIFFGLYLLVLRIFTLDCTGLEHNIQLLLLTGSGAIVTWAIDIC